MKRVIVYVLLFLLPFSAMGQESSKKGKKADKSLWECLGGATKAKFVLDLSEAVIEGIEAGDYAVFEPDWDKEVLEMNKKFISSFNTASAKGPYPLRIGLTTQSDITIVIVVTTVTGDGSNVNANFEIRSKDGETLYTEPVSADEGRFGSVLNLMGDAFEKMGTRLGRKVSSRTAGVSKVKEMDVKKAIVNVLQEDRSIAVHLVLSAELKEKLVRYNLSKPINTETERTLAEQFLSTFYSSLSRSFKGNIDPDRVFLATSNPDGALVTVNLVELRSGDEKDTMNILSDIIVKVNDSEPILGTVETGAPMAAKNYIVMQIRQIGNHLGAVE